jgi:uncharacterized protein
MGARLTEISSPCVNVCALDAGGQNCTGCGRSVNEIEAWPAASDEEKQAMLDDRLEKSRKQDPLA